MVAFKQQQRIISLPTPAQICVRLLGPEALLIPIPLKKKAPVIKWKELTADVMQKREYVLSLNRGNIGVVQGEKSDGICSIDIDHDEQVEPFLALNPKLVQSLRTKGQRGENIWVKLKGSYPKCTKVDAVIPGKPHPLYPWGEWRSTGAQTVIYGVHPCGQPYRFMVEASPVHLEYAEINWPKNVIPPALPTLQEQPVPAHCTQETQDTQETQGTHESVCGVCLYRCVEDILAVSVPASIHQNHHFQFVLARGVLALEAYRGSKFSPVELIDVFNQWHFRSKQFLRSELTKDDYMAEFLNSYRAAKHALGGETILKAWAEARSKPTPPEAHVFETEEMKQALSLCRELQIARGDQPFFLSCRTVAKLLGHNSHSTAAIWLGAFQALGYIKEVKKGSAAGRRLASEYRYMKL